MLIITADDYSFNFKTYMKLDNFSIGDTVTVTFDIKLDAISGIYFKINEFKK